MVSGYLTFKYMRLQAYAIALKYVILWHMIVDVEYLPYLDWCGIFLYNKSIIWKYWDKHQNET
jgi:hypothetical protein